MRRQASAVDKRLSFPPCGGVMRQMTEAPWLALGISRATWYRLGKPTTRRPRQTQAMTAKRAGFSLRSMQRASRVAREAPELAVQVQAGEFAPRCRREDHQGAPCPPGKGGDAHRCRRGGHGRSPNGVTTRTAGHGFTAASERRPAPCARTNRPASWLRRRHHVKTVPELADTGQTGAVPQRVADFDLLGAG